MGFASNRTVLFWLFLNTFLPTMGVCLLGLFANIFLKFHGGFLYMRVSYSIVAPNVGHSEPILSQTGGTIYKFNILYMFYLY